MSSFHCEKCGKAIIDTQDGYATECLHYPMTKEQKKLTERKYPFIEEDYP